MCSHPLRMRALQPQALSIILARIAASRSVSDPRAGDRCAGVRATRFNCGQQCRHHRKPACMRAWYDVPARGPGTTCPSSHRQSGLIVQSRALRSLLQRPAVIGERGGDRAATRPSPASRAGRVRPPLQVLVSTASAKRKLQAACCDRFRWLSQCCGTGSGAPARRARCRSAASAAAPELRAGVSWRTRRQCWSASSSRPSDCRHRAVLPTVRKGLRSEASR